VFGKKNLTWQDVINRLNTGNATRLGDIAIYLNKTMNKYGIVTALLPAHLLGQMAAEKERWRTMVEAGNDDYFKKYEPRTDQGVKLCQQD
jgi:predicted chitinase